MTPKEIVNELYANDGLRNRDFLNEVLHDNMLLEWHSSEGLLVKDKNSLLDLATELKDNFSIFNSEILHLISENNTVSITYNHFGSSIENQRDLILMGRFITIWEFENDKIIKGYQISRPA
ncbi:nuclear transport factor 2-like protein [Flavobacterium terrigena]|uniref:SnoaL-like domain-containing protein n=1 Tax=Flavobacterium terrigena TaxID=402734 RepID=A0A1H6VUK0_9FLAO|nr:hypothetical protein [Flavobacterium terrigena]SEJ08358.1 hypothetical protein SAMN05660918_2313 [Flavobacterium terrigena]